MIAMYKSSGDVGFYTFHISWAKTKVQNIGEGQPASNLLINGHAVEGVQSFVYLGSTINSVDGSRSEQLRRIGIAAGI